MEGLGAILGRHSSLEGDRYAIGIGVDENGRCQVGGTLYFLDIQGPSSLLQGLNNYIWLASFSMFSEYLPYSCGRWVVSGGETSTLEI